MMQAAAGSKTRLGIWGVFGRGNFGNEATLTAFLERLDADVLMTFGGTPRWAAARPDVEGPYGPGSSSPPQSMSDWDDYVRAVVTGRGELVSLEVSVLALRGDARATVAATVMDVVNRALDAADAAVRELLPTGDVRAKVHEITSAFNAKMDALMTRLDQIDRSLG